MLTIAFMRARALAVVLGLVAAPALARGSDGAADVPVLSLDDFLRRALDDNPAVDIARAELARYRALFFRAYYAWTPRLKVQSLLAPLPERRLLRECVVGTWRGDGHDLPLVGPCPGQDILREDRITADTEIGILTRTTAELTLPIYTFGKIDSAQRAARAGVDVGRAALDEARADIAVEIKRAYYGAQLAESVLAILRDGRKRLDDAKDRIEEELEKESGRFTSNDLRKLLVREAELESGLLETEALAEVAWEGLRIAGRFRPGERFTLDSFDLRPVHVEPRTVEAYVELASVSRPDLRMAAAGVRAHEAQVEMAVADFYPDIALVGAFGYARGTTAEDSPDPFASDPYNFRRWGVVLGAEWKLDIAQRIGKLREARAEASKMRAKLEGLKVKVRLEVVQRVAEMERYRRALRVRRLARKAAKGWLVSNTLNFGLGLVSTEDLLDALVAYSQARLEYFRTIYEYNVAVARLSRTVGVQLAVPPPEPVGPEDDDAE